MWSKGRAQVVKCEQTGLEELYNIPLINCLLLAGKQPWRPKFPVSVPLLQTFTDKSVVELTEMTRFANVMGQSINEPALANGSWCSSHSNKY